MEHLHEVNAFTLHHVMYKDHDFTKTFRSTTKFIPEFKKFGADWFKKNEKLEVLCRPCHGLEHARNVEGGSNWQYCHEKMINLMGGKCQECGLSFESNSELGKIFHVHHKNRDGVKKRAQATEDIDDEEREIANNVNEYKLILAMTEEQQLEKLKEFELLCDGCHYFEHMEKHARSEVIDLGMKERMMNLLSFQRVLSMEK
ncbi:predicted protein [Naegleria gruberi]|uniref:Predicted protein n=1 Tax=Naegleria gruberi TaxID=5762 RepID=D2V7A6_NAEGR|nr:uncharacterized protein NAEGRDRAFT_64726 [Naegleria gruberi]EFC47221.1 predicted protein [Naegleria gruberi]|eukprot:XP_002679965.1 predicted protein [Naegleria gruberi strain NEG-M]